MDFQGNRDFLEGKGNLALLVHQGVQVCQVMVSQVFQDLKVTKDMVVCQDFQAQRVTKVMEARQESLVFLVPLVGLVQQVRWGLLEVLASQVRKGKVVLGGRKDHQG